MASANLQIAITKEDRESIDWVLEEYGMSYSQLINMFLKKTINEAGLPFNVGFEVPNQETLKALHEPVDLSKAMTLEEFYKELDQL